MKGIATALAKAQANMGKALKQANNPHFRSKYADLGNVMDACLPALNEAGIALIQPPGEDERGRYVETILIHSESGEQLSCRVPLIVNKNDMQGFGSAVTYARRYGLMAMAGIAPEDDDGNAAAKAAPNKMQSHPGPRQLGADEWSEKEGEKISEDQYRLIKDLMDKTASDEGNIVGYFNIKDILDMTKDQAENCIGMLIKKLDLVQQRGGSN